MNYQFDVSCHDSPSWDQIREWVWINSPDPGKHTVRTAIPNADRTGFLFPTVQIRVWATGKVEVVRN